VNRPTGNPPVLCGITTRRGAKPTGINMAFYAFSSLISASSIDTPQMSPLPEDFNNRVRVIDSDVAAPLSPLGFCLAMCKLTIIVLIKQIQRYNTCSYRYAGRGHASGAEPVGQRERAPSPFYQRRSIVLGPAAIRTRGLLWPYSIRSLPQPLSSSRSITYQKRACVLL
jgi:hypothetical protein